MRTPITCLALAAAGILAGCGGGGFDGTFTGDYQGRPATLTLTTDGGDLSGSIRWGDIVGEVSGTVEGRTAKGTARHAESGTQLEFEAALGEGGIDWTYRVPNAYTGEIGLVSIRFTRGEGASPSEPARAGLDPQLVGSWYSEVGGTGISGNTVTTRIRCAFAADGTFVYGGAESLITIRDYPGGAGGTGGTGPAATTRGRWKSEGGILSYQVDGTEAWVPLGRYSISGSDFLLYTADGGKQLWSRE